MHLSLVTLSVAYISTPFSFHFIYLPLIIISMLHSHYLRWCSILHPSFGKINNTEENGHWGEEIALYSVKPNPKPEWGSGRASNAWRCLWCLPVTLGSPFFYRPVFSWNKCPSAFIPAGLEGGIFPIILKHTGETLSCSVPSSEGIYINETEGDG